MAINFPTSPAVNDTVVVGTVTYKWDGTAWRTGGTGLQGIQGIQGTTGSGTQGIQGTSGTSSANINISAITSADTTTFPVLVGNNVTGDQAPLIDNADFYYDASAGKLYVTAIGVNGQVTCQNCIPVADSSWLLGGPSNFWSIGYIDQIELGATDTTFARSAAGRVTLEGIEIGYRRVVQSTTTGKTLVETDTGTHVYTSGGITVPSGVFSAGDAVTIANSTAAAITITQGASVTMYLAGTATTGNRTLAQRGTCTVLCVASNTFHISGAGLT